MRLLAVCVLVAGTPAWAEDEDRGPVTVVAKLDGATARLTARFEVELQFGLAMNLDSITVPTGGVVTGATAIVAGVRHPLTLTPADEAARQFDAISNKPLGGDRGWAI